MRRLIILFLFTFLLTNSYSQITKGNWLVGGSGAFTRFKTEDVKTNLLELSPNIGYFLLDKFTAGLKPSYTHEKTTSSTSFGGKSWWIYIGPFARYYFLSTEKPINILIEGNYQHGFSKARTPYSIANYNTNRFSLLAGPVFYFNSAVGLELLGGYEQLTYTSNNPQQNKIITRIGLQFHLEKE